MSLGQHAVIVDPERFSGTRQELAERLAPVLRVPAGQVISMLARGRVTVDADLDERTARRLERRLSNLGLPAQIVDGKGAPSFADEPAEPNKPSTSQVQTTTESELDSLLDALDGFEMVEFDEDVEIPEIETEPAPATLAGEESDGLDAWGAVLPGIRSEEGERPETAPPERPPSRTESAESPEPDQRSASLIAQFEETAKRSEERKRPASPPPPQPPSPGPPGARQRPVGEPNEAASASSKPVRQMPATRSSGGVERTDSAQQMATPQTAANRSSAERTSANRASANGPAEDRHSAKPSSPNRSSAKVTPEERRDIEESRAFNASALTAALSPRSEEDRPPFAPTGFDPDPPHMAGAAAAFSVIAPGAGQIFNGDDDEALGYGMKFFLIKPWIDSVKNARRRGEKIAEYWLPRPEGGATFRAIRYVILWWLAVSAVAVMLVALGNWGWEYLNREPVVEVTEAEIATATEDAITGVRLARIEALRALSDAQLSMPKRRFTMSDQERADRLFIIGYSHCEERNYGNCETIMKRVASLNKGDPRAFRLQAWASAARSGDVGKFPALEGVPTLTAFEAEELSVELGVPSPGRIRDERKTKQEMAREAREAQQDAGATDSGTTP